MSQYYDLNNTGKEVQERLEQVMPNKEAIRQETDKRENEDKELEERLKKYTDSEKERAEKAEKGLQEQINAIVSDKAEVSFSVSPSAAFADGSKCTFVFTASSSTTSDVQFGEQGGDVIEEASGVTRKDFSVELSSDKPLTKTYQASFTVAGVSKGSKSATIRLVYPVFYGAGKSYDNAHLVQLSTAQATPARTYQIATETGDRLYFEVPNGMSIGSVQLVDNPNFPTDVAMREIESKRTGADGSAYRCYESVSTFSEGTHNYKVS